MNLIKDLLKDLIHYILGAFLGLIIFTLFLSENDPSKPDITPILGFIVGILIVRYIKRYQTKNADGVRLTDLGTCLWCSKEFLRRSGNGNYCSRKCEVDQEKHRKSR